MNLLNSLFCKSALVIGIILIPYNLVIFSIALFKYKALLTSLISALLSAVYYKEGRLVILTIASVLIGVISTSKSLWSLFILTTASSIVEAPV